MASLATSSTVRPAIYLPACLPSRLTGDRSSLADADKVHGKNGKLLVDATFAPPPLSDPFQFGADVIMHSGTKYFVRYRLCLNV